MNKQQATVLIIAVMIGLILGVRLVSHRKPAAMDSPMARAEGNPGAKVKIMEFIDFQCPACANGAQILKKYFEQHPKDIYLQVKYFPLTNMHQHAMASALYSECAARQGKFWALHELMMPQQSQWEQLLSADPVFQTMAKQAGMEMAQFNACLASPQARKVVNDEKLLGQSMGVHSTPTYFINRKMVVGTKSLVEEMNIYFGQ